MNQPLVTIGMTTYNRGKTYLRLTLDSLLSQTYKNFQLIISDNASTDNTEEICREYTEKDDRVIYFKQKHNIGYVNNVNFLITLARGKYFLRACDDDLYAPKFLETCVNLLEGNPKAIAAGTNFVEFSDSHVTDPHNPTLFYPSSRSLYQRLKQYILFAESDGKEMFIYCALWRREAVEDFFFKHYSFGWDYQDMSFVFKGLTKGTLEFCKDILFGKRARPDSFDSPEQKSFLKRVSDSVLHSRLKRLFTPFFYRRMRDIFGFKELSIFSRIKLILWTKFVMLRLFWRKKI